MLNTAMFEKGAFLNRVMAFSKGLVSGQARVLTLAVCAVGSCCAGSLPAANLPNTVFTEFPIPTGGASPHGIVAGPDGNLWFTEFTGLKIGRLTPDGVFTEFATPTPSSVEGITVGPDGNLWFTETGANQIGRITTDGVITEFPIPTAASTPEGIAAGSDGNLWFTEYDGLKIGRITTAGTVTEFSVPSGGHPNCIAPSPGGSLWFSEYYSTKIGRITIGGSIAEFAVGHSTNSITAGPDGNMWFETNGYGVGRVTPAGVVTLFPVGPTASKDITSGPDGNLWLGDFTGNLIDRMTTDGTITTYAIPTHDSGPWGITAGPDNAVWLTELQGNKIGRLDLAPFLVSSITPTSGAATGGTAVTIAGFGFQPASTVTIGSPASNVVVLNDQQITADTPALLAGTLTDVVVTNPDMSTATLPRAWFADFLDVDQADPLHPYVESVFRNGITAGCGGGNYCRNNAVTRQQMAVFLLKAKHGSSYVPPVCVGLFPDVPCTPGVGFPDWIEQLSNEGITGGCGGGNYCPTNPVTRQQMAVFLLKTEHGSGYAPPACTGIFDDVICTPGVGFPDWIEQLYAENVTGGCQVSPLLYCPTNSVTRGQMAVFLVKTFNLP